MSGRSRVTLADGRRVVGFRKTLAQRAQRTPSHLLPDYEVSFTPPLALAPVVIRGKRKAWVIGQLAAALRDIAPSGLVNPIEVRVRLAAEEGPVPRQAEDRLHTVTWDGNELWLGTGHSIRKIA